MTPERWRQVDEVFLAAMELAPGERTVFLEQACAGDRKLLDEVESLLACDEQADSFIEEPAVDLTTKTVSEEPSLVGQRVGFYRIINELGRGGMGTVYLAQDVRLKRQVALKLLPSHFTADANRLRRFRQEARAASALNHPNILTIYDIGQADGTHFIAAEYIDGVTLRERMKDARLNPGEALDIAAQVASALEAAHEAGIVHRDIKPENVMLRRDGFVKVVDFGLAKLSERWAERDGASSLVQTNPGVVMGTANYMSPEQARGLEVDARTDLWSLGVVLYKMLAGQPPFQGPTTSDIIVAILDREPPPLAQDRAAMPPTALQNILSKSLSKDSEDRYQTAGEMAHDFRLLLRPLEADGELGSLVPSAPAVAARKTGRTVETRPQSSAEYIVSEIRQHKKGALITLASFILLVVSFLYFNRTVEARNSVAVLPFESIGTDADTEIMGDGMAESLINKLSRIRGLKVTARGSAFRYKGRGANPRDVGRELGVSTLLSGRLIRNGDGLSVSVELIDARDNSHIWGEEYRGKLSEIFSVQEQISREVTKRLGRPLGEEESRSFKSPTQNVGAYEAYMQGRSHWSKRTAEELKQAVIFFNQAIEIDPNYAQAYAGLADSYTLLGVFGGLPHSVAIPKAKEAAVKALEMDDTLAEAHASLAAIKEWYERDNAGAEAEYKRAIELNPNYPTSHHWYALYLVKSGRNGEAVREIKRAQELDPLSPIIGSDVAVIYRDVGRYNEAVQQFRRTLETDPNFVVAHVELGRTFLFTGNYTDAVAQFEKAIELSADDARLLGELGYAYAVSGRRGEAVKILSELNDLSRRRYVPREGKIVICAALGDKDQAFDLLEDEYLEQSDYITHLKGDPRLQNLRPDPRYTDLMRRVSRTR